MLTVISGRVFIKFKLFRGNRKGGRKSLFANIRDLICVRPNGFFAIGGGNWNNDLKAGFYFNFNYDSSNANSNIGSRLLMELITYILFSSALAENQP